MTRQLGAFQICFWVVATIQGLTVFVPAASLGVSVFFWWPVIALLFLLPYLAILCEMGTTWPSAQGIHYWVALAFGPRWGARFSWYYWMNIPAWYPSTFLVCSGVLAELFYPQLPLWGHVIVAIVLSWVSVWLVNCDRDLTRALNTVGMVTRLMIVVTLIVGGIHHAVTKGMANPVNLQTLSPQLDSAMMYLPTLVFSVIGAELIANLIFRVGNPRHDLPIGLFGGMLCLLFLHVGGTFAVLSTVPRDQLGLVSGLVQTFRIIFGSSFVGQLLTFLLGLATVVTFVCYMSLWALGGSEAAAAGAENGEMPDWFARRNLHTWQPAGAVFQTGLWSTLLLIIYGLMADTADDLFWSIFAFSMVLYFSTYYFIFAVFLRLRRTQAETVRPFRVPGTFVASLSVLSASTVLGLSIVLFIFPDIFTLEIDWWHSLPILLGIVLAVGLLEFYVRSQKIGIQGSNNRK